jgi:membrane-associated phospholipid phosphatase
VGRFLPLAVVLQLQLALAPAALADPGRRSPFEVDARVDAPVLALGLTLWVTPFFVEGSLPGPACDPCDPAELNRLDRPVVHFGSPAADRAGDVMVAVVPALAAAGALLDLRDWGWAEVAEDVVLIAEAMVLSGVMQRLVSFAVRRPRPFMYREDARPELRDDATAGLSFYSGHTAAAFAAATAFAYTYTVRNPRSRAVPLVWIASLLAASSVPLLRVGAGEHFWTDVLVGAAAGSGFGVLVPALHLRGERTKGIEGVRITPGWVGVEGRF